MRSLEGIRTLMLPPDEVQKMCGQAETPAFASHCVLLVLAALRVPFDAKNLQSCVRARRRTRRDLLRAFG